MSQVIIIHHSEVVREGLAAIMRQSQAKTPLLYAYLSSSQLKQIKKKHYLIVAYAETLQNLKAALPEVKINTIELCNDEFENNNPYVFNLNSPGKLFNDLVNKFITESSPKNTDTPILLTERETEVLKLLAFGHSNKEIADKLFISIHTVISHRKNITEKLGIKSVSGLTVYAIINNLIDTDGLNLEDLI